MVPKSRIICQLMILLSLVSPHQISYRIKGLKMEQGPGNEQEGAQEGHFKMNQKVFSGVISEEYNDKDDSFVLEIRLMRYRDNLIRSQESYRILTTIKLPPNDRNDQNCCEFSFSENNLKSSEILLLTNSNFHWGVKPRKEIKIKSVKNLDLKILPNSLLENHTAPVLQSLNLSLRLNNNNHKGQNSTSFILKYSKSAHKPDSEIIPDHLSTAKILVWLLVLYTIIAYIHNFFSILTLGITEKAPYLRSPRRISPIKQFSHFLIFYRSTTFTIATITLLYTNISSILLLILILIMELVSVIIMPMIVHVTLYDNLKFLPGKRDFRIWFFCLMLGELTILFLETAYERRHEPGTFKRLMSSIWENQSSWFIGLGLMIAIALYPALLLVCPWIIGFLAVGVVLASDFWNLSFLDFCCILQLYLYATFYCMAFIHFYRALAVSAIFMRPFLPTFQELIKISLGGDLGYLLLTTALLFITIFFIKSSVIQLLRSNRPNSIRKVKIIKMDKAAHRPGLLTLKADRTDFDNWKVNDRKKLTLVSPTKSGEYETRPAIGDIEVRWSSIFGKLFYEKKKFSIINQKHPERMLMIERVISKGREKRHFFAVLLKYSQGRTAYLKIVDLEKRKIISNMVVFLDSIDDLEEKCLITQMILQIKSGNEIILYLVGYGRVKGYRLRRSQAEKQQRFIIEVIFLVFFQI